MSTIREEISGTTLANQVRLERSLHEGSFLLVEGSNDANLFEKFYNALTCSIVVCLGRENLLEAITILEHSGFQGAIGLADKDFAEIIGYPDYDGTVAFSDENDCEISILCSPALENVIREFGDSDRARAVQEASGKQPSEQIFEAASFLGAFRLLAQRNDWMLKFEGMRYRFLDRNSLEFDELRMVQQVVGRSNVRLPYTWDQIVSLIRVEVSRTDEKRSLCCGHDCVRVFGRALQRKLGNTNQFNSEEGAKTLGRTLRLAYEFDFFRRTNTYQSIRQWEERTGYQVLQ